MLRRPSHRASVHHTRPIRCRYTFLLEAERLRGNGGAELWWSGGEAPGRSALLTSIDEPCCKCAKRPAKTHAALLPASSLICVVGCRYRYSSDCPCGTSAVERSESTRRQLEAGQSYYLELLCSGGYQPAAECSVGVRVHSGTLPRYDAVRRHDARSPQPR